MPPVTAAVVIEISINEQIRVNEMKNIGEINLFVWGVMQSGRGRVPYPVWVKRGVPGGDD
jgi:hypothetical protein